jgi:hypothetical protein
VSGFEASPANLAPRTTCGAGLLPGAGSAGAPALPVAADDTELAKMTQSPIAAIVSLPLRLIHDKNGDPDERGEKRLRNVHPPRSRSARPGT